MNDEKLELQNPFTKNYLLWLEQLNKGRSAAGIMIFGHTREKSIWNSSFKILNATKNKEKQVRG